jgi:hypothetical protein
MKPLKPVNAHILCCGMNSNPAITAHEAQVQWTDLNFDEYLSGAVIHTVTCFLQRSFMLPPGRRISSRSSPIVYAISVRQLDCCKVPMQECYRPNFRVLSKSEPAITHGEFCWGHSLTHGSEIGIFAYPSDCLGTGTLFAYPWKWPFRTFAHVSELWTNQLKKLAYLWQEYLAVY